MEAPSPGRVAVPVAVAPVRAVAAPPAAPLPSEGTATEAPAPAAHVPDEAPTPLVENAEPVPFLPTNDGLDRAPYAGLHLCRDDVLWLHPSGVYGFRGVDGVWSVASPGVVRLLTDRGEVLFRAAISPETGFCRDVWSPEETGQAMPEGYERFGTAKRRARQAPMGLAD